MVAVYHIVESALGVDIMAFGIHVHFRLMLPNGIYFYIMLVSLFLIVTHTRIVDIGKQIQSSVTVIHVQLFRVIEVVVLDDTGIDVRTEALAFRFHCFNFND